MSRYSCVYTAAAAVVIASIAISGPARAQQPPAEATEGQFALGTVEIIGQREAAASAATTDTVSAEKLNALHRDDLSDALDLIPGVALENTGQRRERTISLRGFTSRQVPLFIDGIPVYVPYDGNVDLSRFGVDYISEIVVSKGLGSLLYGPNTLGGAINVVSHKPVKPLEITARATGDWDSHGAPSDQRVDASIGGNTGTWYGEVTASYATSDGYRLPSDFTPVAAQPAGERLAASDRDSLFTAKLGYQPNADNEYSLSYYRQNGEKYDPPYAGTYLKTNTVQDGVQVRYWNWPYWDKESIYFVARNAITSQGTLRWRLFNDSFRNSLNSFDDASFTTHTRPYAFFGSIYNDFTFGGSADFEWNWDADNVTRIASHFRNDVHREYQVAPASPVMHLQIPTYDVALEHEWHATSALTLTPGYSYMVQPDRTVEVWNSNTRTYSPVETNRSTANNAQLVANYTLDGGPAFFAGVSYRTRFPTIKERFSGGLGSAVPNPSLDPETALHYEVGVEQKGSNWQAKVALFQSRVHDAIQAVGLPASACSVPPCTELENVAKQRNRGFELTAGYNPIDTLALTGEWDLVDIDNVSNPAIQIIGAPKNKYRLTGDWNFQSQWHFRADAQHESERFSNSGGTRIADSFTLVNAFLRFEPVRALGVEVGVRNALDKLYAYEEGFFEPGRTWLGQLDYRFD